MQQEPLLGYTGGKLSLGFTASSHKSNN